VQLSPAWLSCTLPQRPRRKLFIMNQLAPVAAARLTASPKGRLKLAYVTVLGLVPCLLILLGVQLTSEFGRMRALRAEVNTSYETRSQIQAVFSLLQDAEIGQRGYILTNKPEFLDPYRAAVAQLPPQMRKLHELFDGNPDQAGALRSLHMLVDAKLANMEQSLHVHRDEGQAAAMARVATGAGKSIMDDAREVVNVMTRREAMALSRRVAEENRQAGRTTMLIDSLLVLVAVALLFAGWMVRRETRLRAALLTDVQAQAERHRAVVDNAIDAIITLNPSGSIEAVNAAGERMFGYAPGELERRSFDLLVPVEGDDGEFLSRLAEAEVSGGAIREFVGRRKDGAEFPVEVAFGTMRLPTGVHVIAAMRDVSERKRVERLKSEFVSTVSHELRTPLTSIAGSLGLIVGGAAGAIPERATRLVAIAQSNCQRLVRLINDILDIEKIESGSISFDMAPLDLCAVVEHAVDETRDYARPFDVSIRTAASTASFVRADADRMTQVVANLVSNAVKFSPTGGVVDVSVASEANGLVRLTVTDQGPGVPEEFRGRIFTKLRQADSSDTRRKGGTGLGLAIAKEIVERHGGRLWFDCPPSGGARFHVDLPLAGRRPASRSRLASPPRLLVCDDDVLAAEDMRTGLQAEGFRVEVVGSLQALRETLAHDTDFAALLLDLGLPDGDGVEFIQELQTRPATRNLPVVVVSGSAGQGRVRAGPAAWQVVEWMDKPINLHSLHSAVLQLLDGRTELAADILHVDDDPDLTELVSSAVRESGHTRTAYSLAEARRALRERRPDLVILDIGLPDGSGLELLPELSQAGGEPIPVIVYSAQEVDRRVLPRVAVVHTKSKTSLAGLAKSVRRLTREQAA
jgi:PAS domain S-box-containing protein